MLKNKRGISLIVLVITIIVMIILATVVIVSITNNDVVEKANEAVDESDLKTMQEGADIALGNVLLKKYGDISSITTNDVKEQMNKNGMDQAEINKYNITYNAAEGKVIVTKKVEEVELHLTEEEATAAGWTWSGNTITSYIVEGYKGETLNTIIVPCKIGDNEITTIGDGTNPVFYRTELMNVGYTFTNMIFSKGITTISDYSCMFALCGDTMTLPSTITSIGEAAFNGIGIKNVIMIDGTDNMTIGVAAFSGSAIENITLPTNLISIAEETFAECTSLTSIIFKEGLTSIGYCAFGGCTSLISVQIPNSVTTIGGDVFNSCESLSTVKLPANLKALPDGMFSYCTALESIILPSDLESIGYCAFGYCSALKSIKIPSSVTEVSEMAFYDCTELETIQVGWTEGHRPAGWSENWILDCDSQIEYGVT